MIKGEVMKKTAQNDYLFTPTQSEGLACFYKFLSVIARTKHMFICKKVKVSIYKECQTFSNLNHFLSVIFF